MPARSTGLRDRRLRPQHVARTAAWVAARQHRHGEPGPLGDVGRDRAVAAAVGEDRGPPAGRAPRRRSATASSAVSSRGVRARWMPASRQAAATTSDELVSAPVCDAALRAEASPAPAVSSTTGLPYSATAAAAASAKPRPSAKSSA